MKAIRAQLEARQAKAAQELGVFSAHFFIADAADASSDSAPRFHSFTRKAASLPPRTPGTCTKNCPSGHLPEQLGWRYSS